VVDGRICVFRGDTLAEAQSLAEASARHARPIATASPTLRDFLAEWLTRKRATVRPQTYLSYEAHARLHIVPAIGRVQLDMLRPADIDTLHARLLRKVSGTTARHVHMTLFAVLHAAERRGYRISHDLRGVDAPRRTQRDIETLTRDEVELLITAARGDTLEALYVLAVTLGMREGELLGLRWQHVNLAARRLTVMGNATRTLDGTRTVATPKTNAGRRTLTLPHMVVDALTRAPRTGDLVWPGPNGQPLPAQTFYSRRWLPMRERAGIRPISFHALRHTAATLALEEGQPAHVVAAMLGHASVATTLRLYAHVTHASTEALADAIDARYRPRLRVVAGAEMDAKWTRPGNTMAKTAPLHEDPDCRGRESNPYALTSTAP
jgi:integrase